MTKKTDEVVNPDTGLTWRETIRKHFSPEVVAQIERDNGVSSPYEGRVLPKKSSPLDIQVAGSHYKDFPIQPVEYCQKNKLPFGESCVVKYVSRHMSKNGIEDLRKAKHFLELIAQIEYGEEL